MGNQPQDFIEDQHVALLRHQDFSGKIQGIFHIQNLFLFFLFRKIFKAFLEFFKTENLDFRLQTLEETEFVFLLRLQEFNDHHIPALAGSFDGLTDGSGGFPFSFSTVNMYCTFIHFRTSFFRRGSPAPENQHFFILSQSILLQFSRIYKKIFVRKFLPFC